MLNRERFQELSIFIVDLYNEIETDILVNIARRLKMDDSMTSDDILNYQSMMLQQLGPLTQDNYRTMAKYAGTTVEEIRKFVESIGLESAQEADSELSDLLPEAVATVPAYAASNSVAAVLIAYERQALETLNLVNTTILRQSQQVYLDILNKTVARVLVGQLTPQQALSLTASEWAEKGIPGLIDRSGRQWSTEAYVNMVTRTTAQNVTNDMQEARMDDYNVDLVEISSHAGARPKCEPYQGRIFSRSGNSRLYPALSSTSIGEIDGLFGINCGHRKYPFVHGRSKKTYQPYDKELNDRVYKESQQQRKLERDIRKAKKDAAMMKALQDEDAIKLANTKVRERQRKMREFIDDTGRTRRPGRERIVTT